MKSEILLHDWKNGHKLRKDKWQWIVMHPSTCGNARRGNLRQDYAKATYFTQETNMLMELKACGVSLPHEVKVDREPNVRVVVLSPVRKIERVGSKNEAIAEQESVRCLTEKGASGA